MISIRQKKGVVIGVIWSLIAWVPYYTNYLGALRQILGIPAALGLNLELALGRGDAFVYSILLGAGLGFVFGSVADFAKNGIKIIGLFPHKKRRLLRRGL
ncbi:MAG: hypothetical protein PWR06_2808 [Thermoanaerobacteraceae bacterium]|jgi:hypothetical protein|uniref:Uncharacterized protein n=1 Tax=Biomaibacter acetigenes TaxID=2316383 RepID=A0A3G2R3G3_9FIRM|nr:hypothetical protein [Biomaibacter acetigenes]AYO30044.1 hypothetical protein D2962_04945 [Biomaibacter acetigenes]MDK2880092.1 hypothetical protein [Thermoanaerobacteraceae bacterium]MDN5300947.1 hypothetical protein [Thermoanaerobacteraceae bacterium]MDN5311642.1 hypothetical protein [Thermoanaerobacteraceae bacterium]